MKRQIGASAALGIVLLSISSANASGLAGRAYEPFNYASSPSPTNQISVANNLNGSWGWNAGGDGLANSLTGNWGNAVALPLTGGLDAGRTISSPGLTYTATGYPASVGNKATLDGAGGTNNVSRSIGQLVDSGTFYFSYLTERNLNTQRTASLAFFGPANGIAGTPGNTTERFSIGQIGQSTAGSGTTSGNIGLLMNNVNPSRLINAASPIAYGTNVTHLIAGRVDFNPTGNDTITLYVNPTSMTAEPATPYIQTSAYELSSFNSIRLFAGNAATINGVANAAASVDFDEIRIGSSWSDIISTAPATPKYSFTSIDYPGAIATAVNNIDNVGRIVGEYKDASNISHPFILANGVYSSFDVPGAFGDAAANGINSAEQVVGWYTGFANTKAYIRDGGAYTDLNPSPSGSPETKAYAINDAGHVVGYYELNNPNLDYRGFLYNGSTYTTLNKEGAVGSQANGINNADQIVGYYYDGAAHGFLYSGGVYTTIDYPLPGSLGTVAQGINDAGQVAGYYFDASDTDHGFIKTSNDYETVDFPGAIFSGLVGINNAGQVAGYYKDATGVHGYLATPVAAADFDGDGQVDGDDFAAWKGGFGLATGAAKSVGDANGDFDVDGADFLKWQTQLTLGGAALPAGAPVPEPAALTLTLASMGSLVGYQRARRRVVARNIPTAC